MSSFAALFRKPIVWLLAVALAAAMFIFRDYGLTWDEPLFYQYADALGYAYTPANWFSGTFDLSRSYGPSADDHKTRGPGYLVLARLPAHALQALGVDAGSAWHLVNAMTFVLGIYFIFGICRWVAGVWPAVLGSALFASQPLLWGHAFINPKDMPFMVFFVGAIWLGVRLADRPQDHLHSPWHKQLRALLLPATLVGLATSNRVLGPLAGLLVSAYWLWRRREFATVLWILLYGLVAGIVTFLTWPYLWEGPSRFVEVFGLMANNPTVLPVLFADTVYRAPTVPLRYIPFYMLTTLTEPVWLLAGAGFLVSVVRTRMNGELRARLLLMICWLTIPLIYVLLLRPPVYDGMRHFLFMLPPAFALAAAGMDWLFARMQSPTWRVSVAAVALLPGLAGIWALHPYEYAYFNSLVGGTQGAFRHYETDYWLTCYKEAVERFNGTVTDPARLFVHREAEVAAPYARSNITVLEERTERSEIAPGDYILVNTRTNEDLHTFRDAPELLSVGRAGAVFCVIRRIP